MIAAQFDSVAAAAGGCDALVATGLLPAAAGARSVTEKLGIRYVYVSFQLTTLPSPYHPPHPYPGRPLPPEVTDNRVLWDLDAHPWLAADPALSPWQEPADLDVVQAGAWILPDERPLPAELVAFLDAGTPPVCAGFGSMPMRASKDAARAAAPQVVVSQVVDQPCWAGRVADLGIGTAHDGPVPTTGVPVSRARGGPDPPDPRASGRRGRHDPHRRGDGGRDAAGRRGQPTKAASIRVSHPGLPSQDPEHEDLQTLVTWAGKRPRGRRQAAGCSS